MRLSSHSSISSSGSRQREEISPATTSIRSLWALMHPSIGDVEDPRHKSEPAATLVLSNIAPLSTAATRHQLELAFRIPECSTFRLVACSNAPTPPRRDGGGVTSLSGSIR